MKSILFLYFGGSLVASAQCPPPRWALQSPQHGNRWYIKPCCSSDLTFTNSKTNKENVATVSAENNRCKCANDCKSVQFSYAKSTSTYPSCGRFTNVCIAKSQKEMMTVDDPRAGDLCAGRNDCLSSLLATYGCACQEGYCVGLGAPRSGGPKRSVQDKFYTIPA
jgi:hypothetical protein